jgi:hypothetical protein
VPSLPSCVCRSFSTSQDLIHATVSVTKNGAKLEVSRMDDKSTRKDTLVWSMEADAGEHSAGCYHAH